MAAPPAIGYVRLRSTDPPVTLTMRLADERPDVTSGYGGWNAVERPRRKPISFWQGRPELRMTLPVLFDQWAAERSIERQLAQLEKMATPTSSDGEPPQVRVQARGGHVPYQGRRWVISNLTWGDALMNKNGNRVRQQVTIELLEYVDDVYLAERSAAARQRNKRKAVKTRRGATSKRVVVKRSTKPKLRTSARAAPPETFDGEDLATIAANELGDAERWPEIADLNGLRDPQATTTGMVIRLP